MTPRPAVFLDRDGTLNEESGYIRHLEEVRLIPGAAGAVRRINEEGWLAVLVTNQSGPARGYYSEDWVGQLNQRVVQLLAEQGARLDHVEYCPHLPPEEGGVVEGYARTCDCRKPAPGMVHRAAMLLHIDLSRSVVVGDKGKLWGYTELMGGAEPVDVEFPPSPGHFEEWVRAIKGGEPAMSNFPDYASPLSEVVLAGCLAVWVAALEGLGEKIEWDTANMKAKNVEGLESLVKPIYRAGYTLDA